MTAPVHDVVVVGAGHAGLLAARALLDAGRDVHVLERGRVARAWRDRHPDLRLITTRRQSELLGIPYDPSVGRWPSRDDVVTYLDRLSAPVRAHVDEHRSVASLTRGGSLWRARLGDGDEVRARRIVVATGRHGRPVVPATLAARLGTVTEVSHSSTADGAAGGAGPVLVVGAGASGLDAARLLAARGVPVFHYRRHEPMVLPETVAGVAVPSVAAALARRLPPPVLDRLGDALAALRPRCVRHHAAGRARASRALQLGRLPGLDRGYLRLLCAGAIVPLASLDVADRQCTGTVSGTDRIVRFRPERAVLATGFEPDVGFLPAAQRRAAGFERWPLDVDDLPEVGLHLVGYRMAPDGQFRSAEREARRLRRLIT